MKLAGIVLLAAVTVTAMAQQQQQSTPTAATAAEAKPGPTLQQQLDLLQTKLTSLQNANAYWAEMLHGLQEFKNYQTTKDEIQQVQNQIDQVNAVIKAEADAKAQSQAQPKSKK